MFLIPLAPFLVQNAVIAMVILSDTAQRPIYPRWVAYANLFIGAGVGGVSAAASLAHHGRRVLLVEAADRIGGRASAA